MVDGSKGVPIAERKRELRQANDARRGLFPDPEAALDASLNESFSEQVSTGRDIGFKPRNEMWRYPKEKDGSRREGTYPKEIPRDELGRFAKRFDMKEFKEKRSHLLIQEDEPRRR